MIAPGPVSPFCTRYAPAMITAVSPRFSTKVVAGPLAEDILSAFCSILASSSFTPS